MVFFNRADCTHDEVGAGDQGEGVDQCGFFVQGQLALVEQGHIVHAGKGVGGKKQCEYA